MNNENHYKEIINNVIDWAYESLGFDTKNDARNWFDNLGFTKEDYKEFKCLGEE